MLNTFWEYSEYKVKILPTKFTPKIDKMNRTIKNERAYFVCLSG
jgi:hypothetical protein